MFVPNSITLTERQEAGLHILLRSGLADKALEADEKEVIALRQPLVAELPVLDRAEKQAESSAERELLPFCSASQKAEAEAVKAKQAEFAERVRQEAILYAIRTRRFNVRTELINTADARWAQARRIGRQIEEDLRQKRMWWPTGEHWGSNKPRYDSNDVQVNAAREAIAALLVRCDEGEMSALGYADVSQALLEMCEALVVPLAMVEMNPPQFANDGSVGQPLRWNGMKQWLVDKISPPEKREPEQRPTATLAPEARSLSLKTGTAGPNHRH